MNATPANKTMLARAHGPRAGVSASVLRGELASPRTGKLPSLRGGRALVWVLCMLCACLAMASFVAAAEADAAGASSTGGTSASAGTRATAASHAGQKIAHKASKMQIATWFGPGFYGQQTACGQTMTPAIVGVASRTLPCGTLVLVNYKGHRLTVPVIDRGPYAKNGAKWDLTAGAASALTIAETVRVETKVVGKTANTPLLGVPAEAAPSPQAAAAGGTAAS